MAEFESPITKNYPDDTGPLLLTDVSTTTKLLVRSDIQQFGVRFGTSTTTGEALICGTRPGEWLILGEPAICSTAAVATTGTNGFTNIIDYTHSRALFRLSGPPATSALEKACSLDWSDTMTPNGAVASASVAKVTCDIIRNDTGEQPSYLIACDRSFGQYLFDALHAACHEFSPGPGTTIEHQ